MSTETKGTTYDRTITLPEARLDEGGPTKANRWLVAAVVVLAIAVVGLGAGLIVATDDEPAAAPATTIIANPTVTTALDGTAAALSRGDVPAAVAFYADDGTVVLANSRTVEGTAGISGYLSQSATVGLRMERVSDVIGYGTFGAALYRYTSVSGDGYMFRMITLDPAGKILAEEQIERWPAP